METLNQIWFLIKTHIKYFGNTVTEMEKEKLGKKLLECKCTLPRQQFNLINIVREVATKAQESAAALKWCLEIIHAFLDSKAAKYPFSILYNV